VSRNNNIAGKLKSRPGFVSPSTLEANAKPVGNRMTITAFGVSLMKLRIAVALNLTGISVPNSREQLHKN
jgi:hypothetical protein